MTSSWLPKVLVRRSPAALEKWDRVSIMESPTGWAFRVALNHARRTARRRSFEHRIFLRRSREVQVQLPLVRSGRSYPPSLPDSEKLSCSAMLAIFVKPRLPRCSGFPEAPYRAPCLTPTTVSANYWTTNPRTKRGTMSELSRMAQPLLDHPVVTMPTVADLRRRGQRRRQRHVLGGSTAVLLVAAVVAAVTVAPSSPKPGGNPGSSSSLTAYIQQGVAVSDSTLESVGLPASVMRPTPSSTAQR